MMKRFLACLVAAACLLAAFAFAEDSVNMRVIKCSQRVNIRQYPNTNSTIVGQAPLGAVLVGCQPAAKGSDWYAVVYEGIAGYIRGDFLEAVGTVETPAAEAPAEAPAPVEEAAPDAGSEAVEEHDPEADAVEAEAPQVIDEPIVTDEPIATDEPVAEAPAEAPVAATPAAGLPAVENAPIAAIADDSGYESDSVILEATAGSVRVVARRIYDGEREYLAVAGLDEAGAQLWMQETATSGITELTLTDAFVAGIAARPLVMLYNAEVGLCAIDPANGGIRWLLSSDEVSLGASISRAVSGMGVMYIGGYYGPDPVAIDANGTVLWRADSGSDDIYWLESIELTGDGLACAYGNMDGEGSAGTVIYDYSGAVKETVNG